jgi:AcrR family transcriptional regulator
MPPAVKPGRPAPVRRRGRPPSASVRRAVLSAAREMLAEGGPAAVNMERLAARARVSKPTLYRWWRDRHAVMMAALMDDGGDRPRPPARSALQELRRQLHAIVERFRAPSGRHLARMVAASDTDTDLSEAFRHHVVMARRAEGVALLRRARHAGEIAPTADVEVMGDLIYGAIVFRALMGHAPLDASIADAALDHVLRGFTT